MGSLWERSSVRRLTSAALLIATAALYLWDLGASGNANDFYAAAVQAGTKSWKAFFFGSFDSSDFITVDKPPAALWPMEIAGRIFGFNSWSMLVPQAIEGVLSVWLLYAAVRRWFGHGAGLLAGALLAVTPVAALMFRFNNPDALMVLLIVLATYCVIRAIEAASTRWLLFAGLVMGFSFLAKGLQPFTVLPALAIAFLVCAPGSVWRRLAQLLGAGVALVVGGGWWVLAVDLTPAADRPYIGGSGNNTALGLAFGYNGVSRITGGSGGGPGGGGGGGFDGSTGIGRMFNSLNGGQVAWLLPTALVAVVGVLVVMGRRSRTDRLVASLIVWTGWLLATGAVLSFASGIIHTYYTVELAPAIAALVAIGTMTLWRSRNRVAARVALTIGAVVTGVWTFTLLDRSADFVPWLRWVLLVLAIAVAAAVLVPTSRLRRSVVALVAVAGVVLLGGGSAAYAVDTVSTPHTGSTPSAGPAVASSGFGGGFPGGGRGFGGRSAGGGSQRKGLPSGGFPGSAPNGRSMSGRPGRSDSQANGGGFPGATGGQGSVPSAGAAGRPSGTGGGFGGGQTASSALVALLKKTDTRWAAATIGSQSAAPLELSSGTAVMAIGGFSGSDAAPTLAQFKAYVAAGEIRYFIGGGSGGGPGGGRGDTGNAISTWVANHFTSTTVGGSTVYDLTKAKASS